MERIKVIVVQCHEEQLRSVSVPRGFLEIALETDAETVLEATRDYFRHCWKAEVHALQWLFPEDFLLPNMHGETPYLVVFAKTLGQLPLVPVVPKDLGTSNGLSESVRAIIRTAAENPCGAEPWSLPDWLPTTSHWIRRNFPSVRRIFQVRTCPNGAVLRIHCRDDAYYLKTQSSPLAYEWALLKTLNCRRPGSSPRVFDIRPDPNTHLTDAIRGRPIDSLDDMSALRRDALGEVARLQVSSIRFVEELRDHGIPYHPLDFLGPRLEEKLNQVIDLQRESPNHLIPRELENVTQLVRKTARDFENLDRPKLPATLIHGDLNWSNAFQTETGGIALIDWSLSRVAHPFFTLSSTVFASADGKCRIAAEYEALCGAYLEVWSRFAPRSSLRAALDAASRLFWIDSTIAIASLCQPGHVRNLINLPRFLRAALRAYDLAS